MQGGGSSTPSMVAAIQKWKKENGDSAAELWSRVIENNQKVRRYQGKAQDVVYDHCWR